MNTKERLMKFLTYLKISQGKFEASVDLSTGFVNNVGDSIRKKSLDKITSVYPELNTAWLLTGEGSMLKTTPDESVVSEPQAAYGNTGLLKEIQELKKRIKELEEIIKKKDDYINGQKDLLRISDVSINTLKESLSDKNMIIDLLNEKVDSLSSVKRKSTLK